MVQRPLHAKDSTLKASESAKTTPADTQAAHPRSEHALRVLKEGALIGLSALCAYLFMALLSFDRADPGWSHTGSNAQVANIAGPFGALMADIFFSLFGFLAFLFPVLLAYRAWLVLRNNCLLYTSDAADE